MMDQLIARFPEQLEEALQIADKAKITSHDHKIHKVYVAGLGGSGIGADFVSEFIRDECKIPYTVGKGYSIPAYVDQNTLAIASSYSGNTEETLYSFEQIEKSGAKIVIISSGGKLIEIAKEEGYDFVQVPGDWPSPRACLGFSLVQQLGVMYKLGLISDKSLKSIKSSIALIESKSEAIKTEAKEIADKLFNKLPIIYTTDRMSSVAVRLRQQINENSKALCWHHVLPEMNHNELVGWRDKNQDLAVIYLRNDDDFKRNSVRIEINQQILSKYTDTIINVYSEGNDLIEKAMYLVYLGDWVSWYLSQLRGMDSIEVDVIDFLKGELAKV